MGWASELARLRRELIARIDTSSMRLFGWTLTSTSSPLGQKDSVQTGDSPDSDGKLGQRPARRVEPWGLRGRPPAKIRSLWLRLGSSNVVFLGIAPSKAYGPGGLAEGESSLYCSAGGTEVLLDKDGNIKITAASGKDVIVNGGSLKVARQTDPTMADATMLAWITAVSAKFNAPAAPMVSAPGSVVPPTDFGLINGGAANFKG